MIDLIILTYNQKKYTKKVIDTFKRNNLINKIIVIDNNSKRSYKIKDTNKVKYIRLSYQGIDKRATARNIALDFCESEYIWSIDGDCIPKKSDIYILKNFIENYPNCILMGTKNYIDYKNIKKEDETILINYYETHFIPFKEQNWNNFQSFSYFCKKKTLEYFDGNLKGWGLEDIDLIYRLNQKGIKLYKSILFQQYHIKHKCYYDQNIESKKIVQNNMNYIANKYKNDGNIDFHLQRMFKECMDSKIVL